MQFSIILHRTIKASPQSVWQVLNDTANYPHWNPFVVACESTFEPGTAIIMKVKLFTTIRQKETIRVNHKEKLLEYGIDIPFLLHSSRKHILTVNDDRTDYESFFQLTGLLAPLVAFLMAKPLRAGFTAMTDALVNQAQKL